MLAPHMPQPADIKDSTSRLISATPFSKTRMITDYRYYRDIFARLKIPVFSIAHNPGYNASTSSLEAYMSYGLGSGVNGKIVFEVPCSNASNRVSGGDTCSNIGLLACTQCSLVKYCSGRCQRQHWAKHRHDCEHSYLDSGWEPTWITDNRQPFFAHSTFTPPSNSVDVYKNSGYPPYDLLQLAFKEGDHTLDGDFKLCMTAAGDIRNLIETVNHLPVGYSGRLDILLNNNNTIVLNRMLVILGALLSPGPSIEESAELATHLMYSASLPETAASYMRYCTNLIYGEYFNEGEMSFQTCLRTRGRGKLYSAQPTVSVKRPMEMFSSTYSSTQALNSRRESIFDPLHTDDRDRILSGLKPAHRLSLNHFWETGILAPFSLDVKTFKCPNRLLFTTRGEWIGLHSDANPLQGWDVSAVRRAGIRHGLDPSGDILGCLFFHLKSELREFSSRVKGYNINIHLLQYDSRLLSKGISIGVLPAFAEAVFDRIDVGDMADQMSVAECLADWGPLLNRRSSSSCLIMHSKRWHEESPNSIARNNPQALKILTERCHAVPKLESRLKKEFQAPQAPSIHRLMTTLDAFVDHEGAFLRYLDAREANTIGESLGLYLRDVHSIHSKRVGIPLRAGSQKLPKLSKEEFYDLFTIGAADLTIRFAEFQCTPA